MWKDGKAQDTSEAKSQKNFCKAQHMSNFAPTQMSLIISGLRIGIKSTDNNISSHSSQANI